MTKSFFIPQHLVKKIQKLNSKTENEKNLKSIYIWCRSSVILPSMVGHTISIYNGKKHIPIYIRERMIGHKLGEFSPTRNFRGHKKTDKKIVRQKQKKKKK